MSTPSEDKLLRPRRRRRIILRLLRSALIIYIILIVVFSALQNWIIFPGASSQGQKHAIVHASPNYELVELKSPTNQKIAAVFGPALAPDGSPHPTAAQQPTILWFYGNGMCLADCFSEFTNLRRLGNNVFIPEFLGYGMSEGSPSEQSVYATANAAWDHLVSRPDIDKNKIIVAGWSLGAAAAIELAHTRPVAGLMTFSAFTNLKDMARRILPWAPTSLMLKHHFDNESKIKNIKVPILIVHGSRDSIVPFDMSAVLAKAAPHATYVPISVADHNDLFDVGADEINQRVAAFIKRAIR
jgi:pimeloyl-ACP methyl ester carboxylesterase